MAKAIALLSGGLDSTLAVLAVIRQGIEVTAIKFLTPFDCDTGISVPASSSKFYSLAHKYGFGIEFRRLDEMFLEIVRDPIHGYGKNMNPCIDCRILMLSQAKIFMVKIGADFIITGEVLSQRPMSQKRDMLYHIDRAAGVTGIVLRPLSAKLLKVTLAEDKGIIDRDRLYSFSGRSRKPQMALALEYGLTEYPPPAGGCLLTEPNYSHRLRDLLTHNPSAAVKEIEMLKLGRHFRFSPLCKIVVGRDENENNALEALSENNDCLMKVEGYGSPLTLVTGNINDESLTAAASLCVRYSDAKNALAATVRVVQGNNSFDIISGPADSRTVDSLRIEKKRSEKTKV